MQSTGMPLKANPLHVAIIMDGNGRWAARRGFPRIAGHRAGAKTVRRVVELAPKLGVGTLTLFAFSSDNWQRPEREVALLMRLFRDYLHGEAERLRDNGIRLSVIGRRDRLPVAVQNAVDQAEAITAAGREMLLQVAVDYSARDAIMQAAARLHEHAQPTREEFSRLLAEVVHSVGGVPDVDLLIRTSGEQRLSDFLLWECAYAEFFFTPKLWPEFDAADFEQAIREFHTRERRFGRLPTTAAG